MDAETRDLRCQFARDLAWVVSSPSMIVPLAGEEVPSLPPLDPSRIDADGLAAFIGKRSPHRVGHYFERLVLYYLLRIRRFDVAAAGMQIYEDGQTIGELDFVFRDERGQLRHWETAVKFFLHFPAGGRAGSQWIGPNPADTFERKMHRLFTHQLPLSRVRFPNVAVCSAFVRGRMFYHAGDAPPGVLPERLSPQHLRGWWIYCTESGWLGRYSRDIRFRLLRKPFWLSPEACHVEEPQLLAVESLKAALHHHFARSRQPQLISVMAPRANRYREIDRIFVVHASWPT